MPDGYGLYVPFTKPDALVPPDVNPSSVYYNGVGGSTDFKSAYSGGNDTGLVVNK